MPYIRINELDMYYELSGPIDGEPLVFVSGLNSDHTAWFLQVEEFKERYLCLTFDNRDAGRTSPSPTPEYNLTRMAADAYELMQAVGIERAHVVGLSMGGAIAQELALSYPALVSTLTLASTFSQIEPLGLELFENFGPLNTLTESGFMTEIVAPVAYNWKSFDPGMILRFLRERFQNATSYMPTPNYKRQLRAIMRQDTGDYLELITAPTLCIGGQNDLITSPQSMRRLAESIPGARLEMLPNTGHAVQLERPVEFNALLSQHLATHPLT